MSEHDPDQEDASEVIPDAPPRARWEIQVLTYALRRPRRNGLFMMLFGVVAVAWSFVQALYMETFVPAALPIGFSVAGVGFWIAVATTPPGARAYLEGRASGGGAAWWLWQIGLGICLFAGAGLGMYALWWLEFF